MFRFCTLLLALVVGGSADGGDYRLPTAFVPTSYELQVLPHLDQPGPPFSFEGNVTIHLTAASESASIVLHSGNSLEVSVLAVLDESSNEDQEVTSAATMDVAREFFEVRLAQPVPADTTLQLTLSFSGELPVDMKGFYLSSYSHDGVTRYLAATKFEPTYARRAFPCLDEPALKATFTLTIITPPGFAAMSGTQATNISTSSYYPGHSEYVFAPLPVLSTYLVSWMVFEPDTYAAMTLVTSDVGEEDPAGPWGIASAKALRQEWPLPLRVGMAALRELNAIFNDSLNYYTFMDQLSLVALPDFISGAMENWGMITFRERRMLMSDSSSSTETIQSVATTIAHEIVHQWFGDLVSPAWWTYLWLNEGFATYWSYHLDLALDEGDPWNMADQFVVLELQAALRADASPSTHPMTYDRTTPEEVQAIFDSVNYEKAASVLRMFQHILGKTGFQESLKKYLEDNKYGAVAEAQLFSAMDSEIPSTRGFQTRKMGDIFFSWSNNAGYPVVTLTRDYNSSTAYLTQTRFYDDPEETQEGTASWMVPITVAWNKEMFEDTTPGQYLLGEGPLELFNVTDDNDQWVMINVQQAGYYRVQYDERNWLLLTEQLYADPAAIHPLSRAQLVDDALSLASASQLNYSLALNLTRYLTREQDPLPWMAAVPNFSLLYKRLVNSDVKQNFLVYLQELLEPILEYLGGFEGRSNLGHMEAVLHSQLLPWACRVDISYCTTTAIQEFSWISESLSRSVPANRRPVVYCEGLATTPSDTIDTTFTVMWGLFTDSATPPNEKNTILNALGCITEEAVVHSFLQKVVNKDGIRLQDVQTAFSSVISSTQGAQFALSFLKSNMESVRVVLEEIGKTESVLSSMVQWLPPDQQNELVDAVSEWNLTETLTNAINSAKRWIERNEPALKEWLQQEAPISSASSISNTFTLLISLSSISAFLIFS